MHRPARTLASVTAALLLAVAPGVSAQGADEQDSTLDQVRRDQGRISQRLTSLREKMERLAERYTAEGRDRNAVLLQEAMAAFDNVDLVEGSREAEQNLASSMLSSVEQQDELVSGLESIYAVLRDRRDVDELRSRADLLTEGVAELDRLSKDQRQLEARSRAASDTPSELLEEALSEVDRLQEALESGAQSSELLDQAEGVLGEAALAEWLAQEQRALAEASAPSVATQVELMRALEALLGRLQQPLDASGADELMAAAQEQRDRAAQVGAEARAAMDEARGALLGGGAPREGSERPSSEGEPGASGEQGAPASEGAEPSSSGQSGEGTSSEAEASGESQPSESGEPSSSSSGEPTEGASSSESGEGTSQPAGESASQGGQPSSGEQPSGEPQSGQPNPSESQSGESSSGQPPSGEQQSGEPQSGDSQSGQPQSGQQQSGQPQSGQQGGESSESQPQDPADDQPMGREQLEEAAELMEEMRDALADAERAANAARNRGLATAGAAARQAEDQAEELNETAQRLETLEPDAGPELLDRTRELMEDMNDVETAREQGDRDATSQALANAANDLAAIRAMLEQRRAEAAPGEQPGRDPSERTEAQAQQEELERRLRELMDRLAELPDQGFQEPAQRAQQAMDSAQQNLQSGNDREAASDQEEAAEEIEEAKAQLQGERDRYEQLRQDEVLFRLNEELVALHEEQLALTVETSDLHLARGDSDRLSRAQRRAVARLAESERTLGDRAAGVGDTLREDGAVAFVFAIDQVADDLAAVADRLAEQETGRVVSALQQGIEHRLSDLLAVLEEELERRRQAMKDQTEEDQQPQDQQQQSGPPPLVPAVAELLLVQRMELMALSRVVGFRDELGDAPRLSSRDILLLERWANEHARVTDLFESMIPEPEEQPGVPPPDDRFPEIELPPIGPPGPPEQDDPEDDR
jgi:hypothetical protein